MSRPNIIQIVSDQQHPDLVGAFGKLPVQTPNLDRLAREGTAFTRAYTPCPLCTPARASMVTGQYPSTHGAWTIGTTLDPESESLPRRLSQAGYRTGIIGKSHLRPCHDPNSFEAIPHSRDWDFFRGWNGPWYGFDHACISIGHTNEPHAYGMHYGLWLHDHGIPPEPPYFATREDSGNYTRHGLWELPDDWHSGAWIVEETTAFLDEQTRQRPDQPFYLSLNFPDPHLPFRVSPRWQEMYRGVQIPPAIRRADEGANKPSIYQRTLDGSLQRCGWNEQFWVPNQFAEQTESIAWTQTEQERWEIYLGMTSLLDAQVGQLLDHLDSTGLRDNTIIVFTSDHGDYMGHHWLWSKGGSHYDQAVRVPFLLRWPGHVPAGQRSTALQSLVDLPATFLAAAGEAIPDNMEGVDQTATWRAPDSPARQSLLIDHRVEQGIHVRTLVTDQYRLSHHDVIAEDREETELYDLQADPEEFDNIAAERPDEAKALLAEIRETAPQRSTPWPPRTAGA